MTFWPRLSACVVGTLILSANVCAQFPTKPGTVEMSIFSGGTFDFPGAGAAAGGFSFVARGAPVRLGIPKLVPGRKSQPILGGEIGVALTRFLWIYGDYG